MRDPACSPCSPRSVAQGIAPSVTLGVIFDSFICMRLAQSAPSKLDTEW